MGYYCSKIYSQKFSKMAQPGNTGCHALPHSLSLSPFLFLLNQEKGNETKVKSNCAEKLFFPTIVFLFFFLSFIVSIFLSLSLSLFSLRPTARHGSRLGWWRQTLAHMPISRLHRVQQTRTRAPWNCWNWRGSQFLIAPKCIFFLKTGQKRAFCNRPFALWLARVLAADAASVFQTIVDVHAFSGELSRPKISSNMHAICGPICTYVTQARSIHGSLGELKGAHANVPERAAVCRGAWKSAARWPSGLRLALHWAFTWPLHGLNLTHTQARHGATPIYDCWQWRARCTLN